MAEGYSLPSSINQESLEVYAERAFDLAGRQPACYFQWKLAGTTLALTGNESTLRRNVLPSLGSDIQKISSPPPRDVYQIHWVEAGMAMERIAPPNKSDVHNSGRVAIRRVWFSDRVRVEYQVIEDILTLADLSKRRALVQVPCMKDLAYSEQARPIRGVIHWFMSRVGRRLFHGAVIGRKAGGVLIPGRSGSGKSTVAVAGLIAGMHFVGDDMVLVDEADEPRAFGVYTTVNVVRTDVVHGMPEAASILNPHGPSSDKAVFRLHNEPDGFRSGLPLKAIVVPRIGNLPMRVEPCSAAHALASLAPSTLLQMAGEREALFAHCAQLARKLPAYILHTGPRTTQYPRDIARTIDQLLEKIDLCHAQIET